MTYIELLNSFWDSTRFNPCSSNEAAMYFYLLHQCNIRRWINPFEFKTRDLELMLGLSRATISAIRNKLKQRGLIDFGKGVGSGSAVYLICGAKITDKELSKKFCVQSLNTKLNTTLNTTLNTNADSTLYIEEKRNKTKDISPIGDSASVREPVSHSLFEDEDKKVKRQKSGPRQKASKPPIPPTLEEVLEYFRTHAETRLKDWHTSGTLFFDTFNADGWINKYGRHIQNWDSEANKWIYYQEQREKTNTTNETKQTDRFSERRGVEPSHPKRQGFKGTF